MVANKYLMMNKDIVNHGMIFDFDVYYPTNSNKEIELFKERNSIITSDDMLILEDIKALYINDTANESYKSYLEKLFASRNTKEAKPQTFCEKSEALYSNATTALNNLFDNPETLGNYDNSKTVVNELVDNVLDNAFTLGSLMRIAAHDYYTHTHSLNVAIYSLSLGSFLQLSEEELSELGEAALLHDLGKSKICPTIINKNGKLDDKEWKKMLAHPSLGYTVGLRIGITNKKVLQGIKHHHEKMDGSGYPHGLAGSGIPLYARIIGLCDIFDALTSKRSYKEAMTSFEALLLIKTKMNNHVDLKLLNSMILMFK